MKPRRTVPVSPALADSDVIWLVIRRLERAAEMMQRHDYGPDLEEHLTKVTELMDWLQNVMAAREAQERIEEDG